MENCEGLFIDILPEILQLLSEHYLRGYHPALRSTCKRWNIIIGKQKNKSLTVFELSRCGYTSLVIEVYRLRWYSCTEVQMFILCGAAEGGYESICRLAKEWGASDFNEMLVSAAGCGHEHICRLAKQWGANNFNGMLFYAAKGGNENICRLAKKWGANDFDNMLCYAAEGDHENICRLAKEWGVNNFNVMLFGAARGGHENICRLAKEWDADN